MSDYNSAAQSMTVPHAGEASATDTRPVQTLVGLGGLEATIVYGLLVRRMATLIVGDTPVRIAWHPDIVEVNAVAATDIELAAGTRLDWLVEDETRYPHIEAADGAGDAAAWVWTSSQVEV